MPPPIGKILDKQLEGLTPEQAIAKLQRDIDKYFDRPCIWRPDPSRRKYTDEERRQRKRDCEAKRRARKREEIKRNGTRT
jgi:hypothetical protein